jgi:hypothetical protein
LVRAGASSDPTDPENSADEFARLAFPKAGGSAGSSSEAADKRTDNFLTSRPAFRYCFSEHGGKTAPLSFWSPAAALAIPREMKTRSSHWEQTIPRNDPFRAHE